MLEQADAALLIGDPAANAVESKRIVGRARKAEQCASGRSRITNAEMLYVYDVVANGEA